jgi:hypothetical protein
MKKIAVILSFIFPFFCSAQTIHFDDREAPYSIYLGFVNTFTIVPAVGMNVKDMVVSCVNCQLEKIENSNNDHLVYTIKPDKGFTKAQLQIRDNKGVLIKEENFQISRLPTCEIFIGNQSTGENINKENLKLSVGYPSEISLKIPLEIFSWEVLIGESTYSGKGENFTDEVILAIKKSSEGQVLVINCIVEEKTTRISRKLNAEFKVN